MRRLPLGLLIGLLAWAAPLPLSAGEAAARLEPYRLSADAPVPDDVRRQLEHLGHRFDQAQGVILTPEGRPLARGAYADLHRSHDLRRAPIREDQRLQLVTLGLRVDETRALILNPFTTRPLSRLEVRYLLRSMQDWQGQAVLEMMTHILSGADPSRPLPAETRKALEHLRRTESSALPPELVRALDSRAAPAGRAFEAAQKAMTDAARAFDADVSREELLRAAEPHGGEGAPPSDLGLRDWDPARIPPVYMDAHERRLGDAVRAETERLLARNPVGTEVLEHFRGANGRVDMPPFQVLRLDSRALAIYNQATRAIVLNHDYMLQSMREILPVRGREALLRRLADPGRLADYLGANPAALQAFVARHDVTIVHELTHAWQARRHRALDAEIARGNVPALNPLEGEHEAFITECRYMHRRMVDDPGSMRGHPDLGRYVSCMGGADQFRDSITREYLQLFPEGAGTLGTMRELQRDRAGVFRRALGAAIGADAAERLALRLRALTRGTEEIGRSEADYHSRFRDFAAREYPRMQAEGYLAMQRMAELHERDGRPDDGLLMRQALVGIAAQRGEPERRQAEEERARAVERTVRWLLQGPALEWDRWLVALPAVDAHYQGARQQPPPEYAALRRSFYSQGVQLYVQSARTQRDREARRKLLDAAVSLAEQFGDETVLRQARAARRRG